MVSFFEMVRVESGGVSLHDARRQRRWSVDVKPFEISIVPVTEEIYGRVSGVLRGSSLRPVTEVSWLNAIRFCNAASLREDLEEVYTVNAHAVVWHPDRFGYRLPTEAEWEYACRAGTAGPRYGDLPQIAWTAGDHVHTPQDVGLKRANDFGLFDALGNVWEWCWDYLDPARYDDYRVFRGGGFADEKWSVRASVRRGGAPGAKHEDVGFRIARGALSDREIVQGWSAQADEERAQIKGAIPFGWTPRPTITNARNQRRPLPE